MAIQKQLEKVVLSNGIEIPFRNNKINSQFPALNKLLVNGWVVDSIDDKYMVLKDEAGTYIKCRYNEGFDIGHLVEIFVDKRYGSDFNGKIIIDVGASNADSSIYFAKRNATKVIALEPSANSFNLACQNIELNKLDNRVLIVNVALSNDNSEHDLLLSERNENADSLQPSPVIRSTITFQSSTRVKTRTLESLIDSFSLIKIDLLKLDCEGCEYEVITTLRHSTFAIIGEIIMEYHEGPKNLPSILHENGFLLEENSGSSGMGYIRARKASLGN